MTYKPRLVKKYNEEVIPAIMEQFALKNKLQVPKLEKIVINCGVGGAKDNDKLLTSAVEELVTITGQRPVVTRARKAVSNFKLREGMRIGAKVTLRGSFMYEFFDRLVNVALPRVRDFRGLNPKSFDKFGNYALGIKEQIIFPEIEYDKVESIHGMDIIIVLRQNTRFPDVERSREMLRKMGMPFKK